MEQEFVSYEQALALRELGFDEPCLRMSEHRKICEEQAKPDGCQLHNLHCGYPDCTKDKSITPLPLPLKSQTFRWFREKYDYSHEIGKTYGGEYIPYANGLELNTNNEHFKWIYKTYEEAENACIDKLIELAKQQD